MRAPIAILTLLLAIGTAFAQDGSWAGKTVLTKRPGIQIGYTGDDGNFVPVATLNAIHYRVLGDQDGWLKVKQDHQEGWFAKAKAVALEDAPGYFTGRIQDNPRDAYAFLARANAWRLKGELQIAIKDYDEALRLNPSPGAYNHRGIALILLREYDKAVADFTEAIRLFPKHTSALSNRGYAWVALGEDDKAVADFTEAIRLNPEAVRARVGRGHARQMLKEYNSAIADLNEAIRLDPTFAPAYFRRGNAWLAKKDHDRAIADYSEALRLAPKQADAYACRGIAWNEKKEYDRAVADFDAALALNPHSPSTYNNRGNARLARKEYAKAIADYDAALRINPQYVAAYYNRAQAWNDQKEYAKAAADYAEAVRLDPKDAAAGNGLAWLLATAPDAQVRDGRRAVEAAKRALDLAPKNAGLMDTLAAAHAEAGNFEEAVRWQERALESPALREDAEARRRLELYRKGQPFRQE